MAQFTSFLVPGLLALAAVWGLTKRVDVYSAAGCETPFDILPAVWVTSALALTAGLLASGLLARLWRN